MPIDLTDPEYIREMAEAIASHVTEGTERDLGDGNIQRRNHANEFMKERPDGSRIVDPDALGIDMSATGIDTSQPNWEKQFNADAFDKLSPDDQQKITNAIRDHVIETVNDPKTRFVIANEDGSKIHFFNADSSTAISYDANLPNSSTAQNFSRDPKKAMDTFYRRVNNGVDPEIRAQFNTPAVKGQPVGIEGGIQGAAKHYEDVTGRPPHVTGYIEDYDPSNPRGPEPAEVVAEGDGPTAPTPEPDADPTNTTVEPDADPANATVETDKPPIDGGPDDIEGGTQQTPQQQQQARAGGGNAAEVLPEEPPIIDNNAGSVDTVPDAPADAANDAGGRVSGGGAVDNAAAHGDDAIDLARRSGDIADAMKGARAGKLTKLGVVTGVALTAGIAGLLHYAFGEQRELAEDLKDSGRISPEVYAEYVELNERIEAEMQAENLAGQGWLFLATTPAVELSARAQFEEFSRKHNLPEDVHQALGMSMFDGQSLRGEFAQGAADLIPQNMGDLPPELHELWRAKQEMDDAQRSYDAAERYGTGRTRDPEVREARQEARAEKMQDASRDLSGAQAAYQREFARAFSNPETAEYLMSRMDPDMLLEMVTETAQHNAEGKHPLIQEMARMQAQIEAGDEGWIFDSDSENRLEEIQDELKANPQIMYDYIAEVFGGRVEPNSIPQAEHAINQPVQDGFTAMPEFMQNRMIETAVRSVDLQGDMEGVHPYLKDLAELYEAREGGTSRNQASTRAHANARIEEIEQEIRNHPEIIGEFAAQNPEIQNIVSDYQNNKAEMDLQAEIPDARMDSVLLHIKQSAENNGADSFSGENPLVQRLAELHDRRDGEFRGRGGAIEKRNIDAEIRQIQDELRDNPDVLSEYGGRKIGDDLIPDTLQQGQGATGGPSTGDRASITPNDVIDRTADIDNILPPDATLIVQSSDGNASVARGALPDDQIRLMQGTGDQEPATLTEVEQQRALQAQQEQQRAQELAARQAEQQQYLAGRAPGASA